MKNSPILFVAALLAVVGRISAQPVLGVTKSSNTLSLNWPLSTNFDSQLLTSGNLADWKPVAAPIPAPLTNSWVTNSVPATNAWQFFRVRNNLLTNCPVPQVPGRFSLCFTSGRIERSYLLLIPTNYNPAVAIPMAFFLHGHGQTASSFEGEHPDLSRLAQSAGMILVFPQSTVDERGTGWNNFDPAPGQTNVDDAQFILELCEHLAANLTVDRQRVYVGGFSNGGQMVHYLAARSTNTFAAYAAVAASIGGAKGGTNIIYTPAPLEPRSVLIVNATNDCGRPYWGGVNDEGALQPAAIEAAEHWVTNNGCFNAPFVVTNHYVLNSSDRPNYFADCPDFRPPPNVLLTNTVIRTTWIGCTSWVEVAFVELSDGGHLWPDAEDNAGFDANAEVMAFFQRHCRCDQPSPLVIPTTPGTYDLRICDQGYSRKFRLAIPSGYTGAMAAPLAMIFHGGGQSVAEFGSLHPDLFAECNSRGVLLLLPEATVHPLTQYTLWGDKPFDIVVDDRNFVTNLIEVLDGVLNVDRTRVYAAGFSNGGEFSFWLGGTVINTFAAIAAVCSTTGWADPVTGVLVPAPPLVAPMPALIVRGTADPKRPFAGNADCFTAMEDFNFWRGQNGCPQAPVGVVAGNLTTWDVCAGFNTQVRLVRVGGMDHIWPDATSGVGYDANQEVIDFLLLHP